MKPKSWWEEDIDVLGVLCSREKIREWLKSNKRAFGLLSEAEQEVILKCEAEWLGSDEHWHKGCVGPKHFTYRVCSDFSPEYAPEPEKPFDETYAPPGFVAVKNGCCGSQCDARKTEKCSSKWCVSYNCPDGQSAILKRKPANWGEWQECNLTSDDGSKIEFRKIRFRK